MRARFGMVLVLAACAGRPGGGAKVDDQVPGGYLAKSHFQGEWYFRQTVLDVPGRASIVHEGYATALERVRFEIQESALIAYRSGPRWEPAAPEFVPVAAWAIQEHFDVEERVQDGSSLVLVESTARPWWQREFVRVDWGRDLVPESPRLATYPGEIVTSTGAPGVGLRVGGEDADRPEIAPAYIGVVGLYRLVPEAQACAQLADALYPAGDASACAPVTVKVRTSLRKIDPAAPLAEPLPYPARAPIAADLDGDGTIGADETLGKVLHLCAAFGSETRCARSSEGAPREFTVECTPEMLEALSSHPWYRRFGYDAGDCVPEEERWGDRFGFQTVGASGDAPPLAARWRLWQSTFDDAGVPIPYAQRAPRPIVFHTSPGFPPEILPAVQAAATQWSGALVDTVTALHGETAAGMPLLEVLENDCSPPNVRAFVSGSRELEAIVTRVAGSLDAIDGTNLVDVCAALEAHSDFRWQRPGDLRFPMIAWSTDPALDAPVSLASIAADPATGEIVHAAIVLNGPAIARQAAFGADVVQVRRGDAGLERLLPRRGGWSSETPWAYFARQGPGEEPERWEQLRLDMLASDPSLERTLVDPLALRLDGVAPGNEPTDAQLARASPRSIDRRREMRAFVLGRLGTGDCVLPTALIEPAVVGLAADADERDAPRATIEDDVRSRVVAALLLHALGHGLGLAHNFAGSHDALNFDGRFWQILAEYPTSIEDALAHGAMDDRAALEACLERARSKGEPPPTTRACLRAADHATASVMDLPARFPTTPVGPGPYDRAALRFGYGQLVDVFDPSVGVSRAAVDFNLAYRAYESIPTWLGGSRNLFARQLASLPDRDRDHAAWIRAASRPDALPVFDGTGRCTSNCPPEEGARVEVPYAYCDDAAADRDDLFCARWDAGADAEEIVDAAISRNELISAFLASRRGREGWDPQVYVDDMRERTLDPLMWSVRKYMRDGRRLEGSDSSLSLANGVLMGLSFLHELLWPVQGGLHCLVRGRFVSEHDGPACTARFEGPRIELPPSRPYLPDATDRLESVGTSADLREILRALVRPMNSGGGGAYGFAGSVILQWMGQLIADEPGVAGTVVRRDGALVLVRQAEATDVVVGTIESPASRDRALARQAALLAFTSLSVPGDGVIDASEYLFVTLKGAPDDSDYPGIDRQDPAQYVELTDPVARVTYVAVNTPDRHSITHRMLTRARNFLDHVWKPAKDYLDATPPTSPGYADARARLDQASATLRAQLDELDVIRSLRRLYVTGSPGP